VGGALAVDRRARRAEQCLSDSGEGMMAAKWSPHFNTPPGADSDFEMPPWENRQVPMPWDSCEKEVAHLIAHWGKESVRTAFCKVTRGAPRKLQAKQSNWMAVEINRYQGGSATISDACEGLSKVLKKTKFRSLEGISTDAATLRRTRAAVRRRLSEEPWLCQVFELALNARFVDDDGKDLDKDKDLASRILLGLSDITC
jgi:hypothetical protein